MTKRTRRFVHVFSTFGAGGPQVRAVQLMHHLGAEVEHVIMAMDGNTEAREMLGDDVQVLFVDPPKGHGFLTTRRNQARWLREQGANLVLTYNWGAIESVAAAKKARLPLVHHEDGFGPEEAQQRILRRSLVRRWLLRSVPVIVPSTVLVGIARSEWRLRESHVLHLVNGVDLQRFCLPEQPPASMVVGTVGGLRPEKDHHNLLRAVAMLAKDVTVCLVGSGKLEEDLRAQAQQLGISDRVVFAGQTCDPAASYHGFTMFVLSSRTEQMPIAMLEAMASGLAVVATDVGDVRHILGEHPGCVVPREDPAALAGAIQGMLDDPELRARSGQANRRIVAERYESATCLERFCEVYRGALR